MKSREQLIQEGYTNEQVDNLYGQLRKRGLLAQLFNEDVANGKIKNMDYNTWLRGLGFHDAHLQSAQSKSAERQSWWSNLGLGYITNDKIRSQVSDEIKQSEFDKKRSEHNSAYHDRVEAPFLTDADKAQRHNFIQQRADYEYLLRQQGKSDDEVKSMSQQYLDAYNQSVRPSSRISSAVDREQRRREENEFGQQDVFNLWAERSDDGKQAIARYHQEQDYLYGEMFKKARQLEASGRPSKIMTAVRQLQSGEISEEEFGKLCSDAIEQIPAYRAYRERMTKRLNDAFLNNEKVKEYLTGVENQEKQRALEPVVQSNIERINGIISKLDEESFDKATKGIDMRASSSLPQEDNKRLNYTEAKHYYSEANKLIEAVKQGKGLVGGFVDKGADKDLYTLGLSELGRDLQAVKLCEKLGKGEELTPSEQEFMDARSQYLLATALYSGQLGSWYKAGQTTAQSIEMMAEMFAFPSGKVSKFATKGLRNLMAKQLKNWASKGVLRTVGHEALYGAEKAATGLLGNAVAAATMTTVMDMPQIASQAIENRLWDGKDVYNGTRLEDGKFEMTFTPSYGSADKPSMSNALWNAWRERYHENLSEMFFEPIANNIHLTRLLNHSPKFANFYGATLGDMSKWWGMSRKNSVFLRSLGNILDSAHMGGFAEEYAEEILGMLLEAPYQQQDWSAQNLAETAQGLIPIQAMFALLKLGGHGISYTRYSLDNRYVMRHLPADLRQKYEHIDHKNYTGDETAAIDLFKNSFYNIMTRSDMSRDEKVDAVTDLLKLHGSLYADMVDEETLREEQDEARGRTQQTLNETDGMEHIVTLQGEQGQWYVTRGNIVYDEHGNIDTGQSDDAVTIVQRNDDGTLTPKIVNVNELTAQSRQSADIAADNAAESARLRHENEKLVGRIVYIPEAGGYTNIIRADENGVYMRVINGDGAQGEMLIPNGDAMLESTMELNTGMTLPNGITIESFDGKQVKLSDGSEYSYEAFLDDYLSRNNIRPTDIGYAKLGMFKLGEDVCQIIADHGDEVDFIDEAGHINTVKKSRLGIDGQDLNNPAGKYISNDGTQYEVFDQGNGLYTINGEDATFNAQQLRGFMHNANAMRMFDKQEEMPPAERGDSVEGVQNPEPQPSVQPKSQLEQDLEDAEELALAGDLNYIDDNLKAAETALKKVQQSNKRKSLPTEKEARIKALNERKLAEEAAAATVKRWQDAKNERDRRKMEQQRAAGELRRQAADEKRKAKLERQQEELLETEGANGKTNAEKIASANAKYHGSGQRVGNKATKTLADGTVVSGTYKLVEADSLTPSHDPSNSFKSNENAPHNERGQNINDRDYEHDRSAQQETVIASQTYDGRAIAEVPTVSQDGIVYDGNGRTMAGQLAAQNETDGKYLSALSENAANFGFSAADVSSMKHPRLVFEAEENLPYTTETYALFNRSRQKTMNIVELAVSKSKSLSDKARQDLLAIIEQYETLDAFFKSSNAAADVLKVLQDNGIIGTNELAALVDGELLSQSGKEFVSTLIVASLFDEETIRRLGADKGLKNTLLRAAKALSENALLDDYSINEDIKHAITLIYEARGKNMPLADYVRQGNIFEGSVSDRYSLFEILLAEQIEKGVEDFRRILTGYNVMARDNISGQMSMFGDMTPESIKTQIFEQYGYKETARAESGRPQAASSSQGDTAGGRGQTELAGRARELSQKLGVNINLIDKVEQIPASQRRAAQKIKAGEKVNAWIDLKTGEVYVYVPNINDVSELDRKVFHEIVAHRGMRQLLGDERYDVLCRSVIRSAQPIYQFYYLAYAFDNNPSARPEALRGDARRFDDLSDEERKLVAGDAAMQSIAGDEYIASVAERVASRELGRDTAAVAEAESEWKRICQIIRMMFERWLGGSVHVSDYDIAQMLHASFVNLKRKAPVEFKRSESLSSSKNNSGETLKNGGKSVSLSSRGDFTATEWWSKLLPEQIPDLSGAEHKAERLQWAKDHSREIIDAYIQGNGNVLDPDRLRLAFIAIGYNGSNANDYAEAEGYVRELLYDKLVQDAVRASNPTILFLTGNGGAGKSTAEKDLDLKKYGVVVDSSLNHYESLDELIRRAAALGISEKDMEVAAVYNDLFTSYTNGLRRGRGGKEGAGVFGKGWKGRSIRGLAAYLKAYSANNGKLNRLVKEHPEVGIAKLVNNSGNQNKDVTIAEALKWNYTIKREELDKLINYIENEEYLKERKLSILEGLERDGEGLLQTQGGSQNNRGSGRNLARGLQEGNLSGADASGRSGRHRTSADQGGTGQAASALGQGPAGTAEVPYVNALQDAIGEIADGTKGKAGLVSAAAEQKGKSEAAGSKTLNEELGIDDSIFDDINSIFDEAEGESRFSVSDTSVDVVRKAADSVRFDISDEQSVRLVDAGLKAAIKVIPKVEGDFGKFAQVMVTGIGERIKPYLTKIWGQAYMSEELDSWADKMTPRSVVRNYDLSKIGRQTARREAQGDKRQEEKANEKTSADFLNEALKEVLDNSGKSLPANITIDESTIEDNPDSAELTARLLIDGKPSDFSVTILDQSLGARGLFDPTNMVKFYPSEMSDKWDWDLADRLGEEFNKGRTKETGFASVLDESDAVYFYNMQAALDFAEKARQAMGEQFEDGASSVEVVNNAAEKAMRERLQSAVRKQIGDIIGGVKRSGGVIVSAEEDAAIQRIADMKSAADERLEAGVADEAERRRLEIVSDEVDKWLDDNVRYSVDGYNPAADKGLRPAARAEMQSIKARAQADGTFMLAPNGKPTNLTERQWLQVRTRAFKEWFGDWEKVFRIEKLRKSEPIKATGNEYQGKYELNAQSAAKYILDELRGEYINKDSGDKIHISRKGAEKVTHHDAESEIHLKSISLIPQMIENAIYIAEEQNEKSNTVFDTYRYYVVGLNIGGVDYTAKLVVGVKNGEIYYDHALTQIEKGKLLESIDPIKSGFANKELNSNSKDTRLFSILQTNSSQIVDANGEPLTLYHQTNNDFTVFDPYHKGAGQNDYLMPHGIFMKPTDQSIRGMGDKQLALWADIKNPLSFENREELDLYLTRNIAGYGELETEYDRIDKDYSAQINAAVDGDLDLFRQWREELGQGKISEEEYHRRFEEKRKEHDLFFAKWREVQNQNSAKMKILIDNHLRENGNDGIILQNDEGSFGRRTKSIVALSPNQVKSATDNNGSFSEENDDIRFSISNASNEIFVSNAERAVEGIKQEKATAEQWLKMIEKVGGLKAGEDKWIGLSDWLKGQRVSAAAFSEGDTALEITQKMSKPRTVSKQEILDYIRQNKIEIEEVEYGDVTDSGEFKRLEEEFSELCWNIDEVYTQRWVEENNEVEKFYDEMRNKYGDEYLDALSPDEQRTKNYLLDAREVYNKENPNEDDAFQEMVRRYGDDFEMAFWHDGARLFANDNNAAGYYTGGTNQINSTRLAYTTQGLTNKREIALVVPTIESWNESDEVHFGDAGEGRAVAWIRFGDAYIPADGGEKQRQLEAIMADNEQWYKDHPQFAKYGIGDEALHKESDERITRQRLAYEEAKAVPNTVKVLVIDEIQSKRHQEGREKGYREGEMPDVEKQDKELREQLKAIRQRKDEIIPTNIRGISTRVEYSKNLPQELQAELATLREEESRLVIEINNLKSSRTDYLKQIPAAPFEKNWHELAMKRMLRFAAENGYDKVAWTTGDQQAERYNLGNAVERIEISKWLKPEESIDYDREHRTIAIHPNGRRAMLYTFDRNGDVLGQSGGGGMPVVRTLPELVGKELALKLLTTDESELSGNGLRIGGEGMRGFYDDMLPRFMQKYGKKWGSQVGEVTMPGLEDGYQTMHSVDVTDAMRESVLEGQLMFSVGEAFDPSQSSVDVVRLVSDAVRHSRDGAIRFSVDSFNNGISSDEIWDELGKYDSWNDALYREWDENGETLTPDHSYDYYDLAKQKGVPVKRYYDAYELYSALERYYKGELLEASQGARLAMEDHKVPVPGHKQAGEDGEYHHMAFLTDDGERVVKAVPFVYPEDVPAFLSDDTRFSVGDDVEKVNAKFNDELQQQIDGTLPQGHVYQLGRPSAILRSYGFPNVPIELSAAHLSAKAKAAHHQYSLEEIKGLVKAIQKPIALFMYGDKSKAQNAIIEFEHEGKNFVVGVHFNQIRNGIEVSSIRGLYPKDNAEWLNWIMQDKALYLDKEKIQTLIDQQRRTLADVDYLDLDSLAKVIQNFDNSKHTVSDSTRFSISERDREYADAVKNGDTEKAQQMLRDEAKRKGYNPDSDYQGTTSFNGTAPSRNTYFPTRRERVEAYNSYEFEGSQSLGDYIEAGIDIGNLDFSIHDPRGFYTASDTGKESIINLRNVVNGKRKTITMYRSVPKDIKENSFRNGDWITPSKQYAIENAYVHGWDKGYHIIEQEVSVDDIWWDCNDINEWGYDDGKDYVYKNTKNNRKLFEVTYDDKGNLIPLSQRFRAHSDDIRFSVNTSSSIDPYSPPRPRAGELPSEFIMRFAYWQRNRTADVEHARAEYSRAMHQMRSWRHRFVESAADKYQPIRQFNEWLKEQGVNVSAEYDAYNDMFLSMGRAGYQMQQYKQLFLMPMIKSMRDCIRHLGGISLTWQDHGFEHGKESRIGKRLTAREILGVYAQAKDIEEAKQLGLPDRGEAGFLASLGVSHTDLISMVESAVPQSEIDGLWSAIRNATKFSLQYQLQHGFIEQDTFDKYNQRQFYVPERGWRERDIDGHDTEFVKGEHASAGNPYNAALVAAEGRGSLASDPFAYIQSIAESTITSVEKNRTKQKFLRLCIDNKELGEKSGAFIITTRPSSFVAVNPTTGAEKRQLFVEVIDNGKHFYIQLQDEHLANALNRNFDHSVQDSEIGQFAKRATRFMSAMLTQYNPEFAFRNFFRDFLFATVANGMEQGAGFTAKFLKHVAGVQGTLLRYLSQDRYGDSVKFNGAYGNYLKEYFENGAQTGWSFLRDIESLNKEIEKLLNEGRGTKIGRGALETLTLMTELSELTVRFAQYVTMREMGKSSLEAAAAAKEITVNFDRRGTWSGGITSLFGFFNATVQGTFRALNIFKEHWGKMTLACATFFVAGFMNAMMNPDDPDDEISLSDFTRMNYFNFGNFYLPVPHFFRMFFACGANAYWAMSGRKTVKHAIYDSVDNAMSEIIPASVFQAHNIFDYNDELDEIDLNWKKFLQAAAPTIVSPIADVALNIDFRGAPVHREPFVKTQDGKIKDIALYKSSTAAPYILITNKLHEMTGGNPDVQTRGADKAIDINPSNLEHITEGYVPTFVKLILNGGFTAYKAASGEDVRVRDIPFAKGFYRDYDADADYAREYYRLKNRFDMLESTLKDVKKHDPATYADLLHSDRYITYRRYRKFVSDKYKPKDIRFAPPAQMISILRQGNDEYTQALQNE